MAMLEGASAQFSTALANIGIIAGLLFTGIGFWRDARVRRAETLIEITKLHRELWTSFDERPDLAALFDKTRDVATTPLSPRELRFANLLFLHMHAAHMAERAGVYRRPERLKEDIQDIFSHPALRSAWDRMRHFHDRRFVRFVESFLAQ